MVRKISKLLALHNLLLGAPGNDCSRRKRRTACNLSRGIRGSIFDDLDKRNLLSFIVGVLHLLGVPHQAQDKKAEKGTLSVLYLICVCVARFNSKSSLNKYVLHY